MPQIKDVNTTRTVDEQFQLVIGNDVWVGKHVMFLAGIVVGDGAVVGAGSVVTKNVPPYAVVAGNPARSIRYRFDEASIAQLLRSKWWDLPLDSLKENALAFSSVSDFLKRFHENK